MAENETVTFRKPRAEPAAEFAIADIEKATGKRVSLDHIVWLQDAARRMTQPERDSLRLVDLPVECGGVLLWPLTFAAVACWREKWFPYFGDDYRAWAYVSAHANMPRILRWLPTRWQIQARVNAWLLTLRCGPAQLREPVAVLRGRDEFASVPKTGAKPPRDTVRAQDWGDVIALLCAKYPGTGPDYWGWQVSIERCYEMLDRACEHLPEHKQPTGPSFSAQADFSCLVDFIKAEMLKESAA